MGSNLGFPSVLSAARVGAEWAWSAIYREYSPAVLCYLRHRGAHEPEDLLGEVFVQVVRNLPDFDGCDRQFRAWLFLIARNRLTDERRRDGRNRVDIVPDTVLQTACGVGDAEEEAMRRFGDEQVRTVLARLTPSQREVILLRVVGGLTVEEVALVVGRRPGAVKALQLRGLAAIRKEISKGAVSI